MVLLLVCVEKVGVKNVVDNMLYLIFNAMVILGGVNVDELGGRLISWSRDGNIVFQGSKAKM
jgi:hypothetical protein